MKKLILMGLLGVSTIFANNIKVENSYIRATPPNLPNSAAFMTIINDSNKAISLVKVSSNVSKAVELHTHDMKDGIMKMYQVPQIDIEKNTKVQLKPGGFHIMFIGLSKPLKEGNNIELSLEFSNGEIKTIIAPIKKVMSGMKHHANHMHHHKH